jgi:hypothetical protein
MKKLVLASALIFNIAYAFSQDVSCEFLVNSELVSDTKMSLEPKVKKMFEKQDNFRFYFTSLGNSKYEIEVYNPSEPSRIYSSGYLRSSHDRIEWAQMAEDYLFEISCRLLAEK